MTDRILLNHPKDHKKYGELDEVFVSNCDVHLEQMSEHGFYLGIYRGKDNYIQIWIAGKKKVWANCEYDFEGLVEEVHTE